MLELSSESASILPWKTVSESVVNFKPSTHTVYTIEKSGLIPWPHNYRGIPWRFPLASGRFGWDSLTSGVGDPADRFFEELKSLGAEPDDEVVDNVNCRRRFFCFWFDVSSETNEAHCKLSTAMYFEKPIQRIYLGLYCKGIDQTVLNNLAALDHMLYAILVTCRVPEV